MAKPRKFSEKIALHNQKQAEETAAFEKIMREVSDATSKSALVNLEEMKTQGESHLMYRCERSSRGIGPVRSRTSEKRIDTSPYSSGTYLSPPLDSNWRRTNSDSALHQSAMNMGSETSLHSPGSQRRVTDGQLLGIGISDPCDPTRKHSPDGRPRSSCSERVPGINIFPSQPEPGTVQIPIGNNTGSLPDLTSFHFPPPLPTPLDQEDPSSSPYSTSPQAASPSTLSPTSISSRPMGRFSFSSPQDSQGPSPGHSPDMRRRHYPAHTHHLLVGGPPSPTQLQAANHLSVPSLMNSRYLHTCKGLTLDNSGPVQMEDFAQNQFVYQTATQTPQTQMQQQHHSQQVQQPPSPQQQQQQHVQNHQSPTQSLQHSPPLPAASPSQQQQSQTSPQSQHQQHQQQQAQQQQQSQSLISNSQNISAGSPLVYRSGSPGDTTHSGPQSPVSPASSPGIGPTSSPFSEHNFYNSTSLQQHFEQFSMMDNPVPTNIGYSNTQINTGHSLQAVSHSPEDGLTQVGTQELLTDPGYYSQSPSTQLQYNRPVSINPSGGSTQQTTPQTPNTPSSIPDIILTDFSSSTGDDLSRQEFVKDLGTAMSGSFDTDLFPSDETLREGLDPIDFDGLQMLTDPDMNVITDPATEDNFRLDKLK